MTGTNLKTPHVQQLQKCRQLKIDPLQIAASADARLEELLREASPIAVPGEVCPYMQRGLNSNLSGNEVYYTACSLSVILKNWCSEVHCQKGFNSNQCLGFCGRRLRSLSRGRCVPTTKSGPCPLSPIHCKVSKWTGERGQGPR